MLTPRRSTPSIPLPQEDSAVRRMLCAATLVISCSIPGIVAAQDPAKPAPDAPKPNNYGDTNAWLCRPGLAAGKSACDIDHTTTVIAANGALTRETWAANPNAPIDCFYVYPTISTDPTDYSDMTAD